MDEWDGVGKKERLWCYYGERVRKEGEADGGLTGPRRGTPGRTSRHGVRELLTLIVDKKVTVNRGLDNHSRMDLLSFCVKFCF